MLNTLPRKKSPSDCLDTVVLRLQNFLNKEAVKTFGQRNSNIALLPPVIVPGSTYAEVQFTKDERSAYANLSPYAGEHWENMVYQLAHELVHLLDPLKRPPDGPGATWFEEAVATSFALKYLRLLGRRVWEPSGDYEYAYACIKEAGPNHLYVAGQLRRQFGHLSNIPADALKNAFNCRQEIADQLARRFLEKDRIA